MKEGRIESRALSENVIVIVIVIVIEIQTQEWY